ncbi:hypothetical protein AKJ16_DCAP02411 [Drosera capensis]
MEEKRNRNHRVGDLSSSSSSYSVPPMPIDSSNVGFQGRLEPVEAYVNKHGLGLGVDKVKKKSTGLSESSISVEKHSFPLQRGRLEPVEAYVNKHGLGLGVDKVKKKSTGLSESSISVEKQRQEDRKFTKKEKQLSKRIKKMLDIEKQIQEKEFERQFFREFWPDNV